MPEFIPGRELARLFYDEVVAPMLGRRGHSAALMGWGSDVLGFDTERSTDHGWGPRLNVFAAAQHVDDLARLVDQRLPHEFRGWPTRSGWDEVEVSHHVEVTTIERWLDAHLGFDPRRGVTVMDWLSTPQQLILEVISGPVFHDGLGALDPVRGALAWYPDHLWLWLLACQWRRISQEEAFAGRAAQMGDEVGSRIVAARMARDIVRLCFLMERAYAPYTKWLGSAFSRLDVAAAVGPPVERAMAAAEYQERESALVEAYEVVAERHNALRITETVDPKIRLYHGRPFRVLHADRFVDACLARITDDALLALPTIGAIDQFVDSTDIVSHAGRARQAAAVFLEIRSRSS